MSKKKFFIENWMVAKLGLSGNDLVLFALIWSETDGGQHPAKIDYQWSEAIGVTRPTFYNVTKKLLATGYVTQPNAGEFAIGSTVKEL